MLKKLPKGKQSWKPKFANKLAYLSTMCRDKTQIAEAHYLSKSTSNNIHKELVGSVLKLHRVTFRPVPLTKTPPYSQVSTDCFFTKHVLNVFSLVVVTLLSPQNQKMNVNSEHTIATSLRNVLTPDFRMNVNVIPDLLVMDLKQLQI